MFYIYLKALGHAPEYCCDGVILTTCAVSCNGWLNSINKAISDRSTP